MNNLKIKGIATFLIIASNGFCQVPADSLPGTYAGQYWYANPATSPWVITADTFYVQSIDSTNCLAQGYDSHILYNWYYYTDYYSCNGSPPATYYMKFYSADSVKEIENNVAQPPPNPALSHRFYGKRISNKIASVKQLESNAKITVYPNPVTDKFYIETASNNKDTIIINLFDIIGKQVIATVKSNSQRTEIDVRGIQKGVYILKFSINNNSFNKKITIE